MVIRKRRPVTIKVDELFFNQFDKNKTLTRKKLGIPKLTFPQFSRMIAQSGRVPIPRLKNARKNVQIRKKRKHI